MMIVMMMIAYVWNQNSGGYIIKKEKLKNITED